MALLAVSGRSKTFHGFTGKSTIFNCIAGMYRGAPDAAQSDARVVEVYPGADVAA